MALDGSFSPESAVRRFLDRCPKLRGIKQLDDLVKKGHMVTEEDILNSVAELFLHPNYTIPLIGCFRPVSQKIIDKAVALLKQCNQAANFKDIVSEAEYFVDAQIIHVIEHCHQNGGHLTLHELACLAFCRAIDLDRSLMGSISVSAYFESAPPPFERILRKDIAYESPKVIPNYLQAMRISYRLLLMGSGSFCKQWDTSCFVDHLKGLVCFQLDHATGYEEDISDIRWLARQMLSVVLKMRHKAIKHFGIGDEEAASSYLRWEEFCQDVALEKVHPYFKLFEGRISDPVNRGIDFSLGNYFKAFGLDSLKSRQSYETEPVIKRRRLVTWDGGPNFVMTSKLKTGVEMVLLAVSQKWPVLLYGPACAGKTTLISKLAWDSGNTALSIHMDDQMDGKTLVGTYVCAEQPGEFKWQPGSLSQAVRNGYWVVFEDIDRAPPDVHSILLPLLEGASSFITGRGEEITVAESFRLFSTVSTSKINLSEGLNAVSTYWRRLMIGLPNNVDIQNIVKSWYPNLDPLAGKLIETFERINSAPFHHFVGFQPGNYASSTPPSRFSLRDLLKWCKRIAGLDLSYGHGLLTDYQCQCIYQEAVDIFAASLASSDDRLMIMKDIAKLWAVTVPDAVVCSYKPEIQGSLAELRIGRITFQRIGTAFGQERLVKMRSSLQVLERIACSVNYNEPVLLVGETGLGKTTLVQNLALMLGQKLTVLNLSQQSDVADLLGGFKPMDPRSLCIPLYKEFQSLFSKTFTKKKNNEVLPYLQSQLTKRDWKRLLKAFQKFVDYYQNLLQQERCGCGEKRKKPLTDEEMVREWESFSAKLEATKKQIGDPSGMIFSFVEGAFVTAIRNGEWILLDEINLAPPETLQRVIGVLDGEHGSLCLAERGDVSHIPRHPNFRIFACMNPATDAGKRDLPYSLRSRFTEYFIEDVLDKEDLKLFINKFMEESQADHELEQRIIKFYEMAKKSSEERLQDGANQKPQYSLRSLYRALEYTRTAKGKFGFQKAIYDGFCMFFATSLDRPSAEIVKKMIKDQLLGGNVPLHVPFEAYLRTNRQSSSDKFLDNYVLTDSVKKQLGNLARAVFIKRYPVLLQGPTSSGKTSLVRYLAAITGHEFVRINNHEHTDLQEYLGCYISDASGKLVFHEGVLVRAVRNGHWIVLDELNLAPSDVLEALNRLLDDNRELFVPELQETIRAHPNFMLFAAQNPPNIYGGRKMLSRAFRNRFVEVHVDEIPEHELSIIIEKRCKIARSRADLMVKVMKDLQLYRQGSKVFAGKHGFITPRDLFRWANRLRTFDDSKLVMAQHGYHLLADRLRDEEEKQVVLEVLEKHLRVKIVKHDLYKDCLIGEDLPVGGVILTPSMRRLYFLVQRCYELREPVLLVGETGGGKTTVCQLLSTMLGIKLHILNCHQYTETSDFLGGFYPIRERSRLSSEFKYIIEKLKLSKAYINFPEDLEMSSDIGRASYTLGHLARMLTSYKEDHISCADVTVQDLVVLEQMQLDLTQLHLKWESIFMWQDGPLVQAMKDGDLLLVDEISLADDSVLERLNSVLEPERKLSLAEKGGPIMEEITAHENFFLLATMNPGGDYGKKELSPALRNRFTEIWVPSVGDLDELRDISSKRLPDPKLSHIVDAIVNFWEWFNQLKTGRTLTVRDLLSWIQFINATKGSLKPDYALIHGLFLILLDGLSLGTGISRVDADLLRERCLSFILGQKLDHGEHQECSRMENYGWGKLAATDILLSEEMHSEYFFGISPFYIAKGNEECVAGGFEFLAPTTRRNALRVLRAMQLPKPVLLEGSPGVGKTSLIVALGKYSGHKVVRINLSEQTDLMDLLGSDLPVESDEGMKFAWSDGILLQALKEGCWVLLDELNLAPQSVLEGLNAILDHRAEVFIPELGLTFKCPSSFRVFACQNPLTQGGGRKGLPRSFLNRFTKVYIDELVEHDYLCICRSIYPSIPRPLLSKLIILNRRLHEETMIHHKFAQDGSPWEFNLRDVMRSCQIIQGAPEKLKVDCFLNVLYIQRMRTATDRKEVLRLYEETFGVKPYINPYPRVQLNSEQLIVGNTAIMRNSLQSSEFLNSHLNIMPGIRYNMEVVLHCLQHQWMCILVGPTSSGKTSLIRLLAQLTGNVLNELNLSSSTDISDLLGCFEQYNAFHNYRLVVSQVERYINEYSSSQLEFGKFTSERNNLITKWLSFSSRVNSSFFSASTYGENWETLINSLSLLVQIIRELQLDVKNSKIPVSWSSKELNRTLKAIAKLQEDNERRPVSAKFEWVAGPLIKAVENGEWIVLENANLCNPTVLDRINSLVESSGSITVNECGIIDGTPVVLRPHPNFRIFLTVNPNLGEVSRAMRNRGVEIFMMPPYWLIDEGSSKHEEEFELRDVKRFLVSLGVQVASLVDSMAKAHLYARNEGLRCHIQITSLELVRWVQLFQQLMSKGNHPFWSLHTSWEHTYLSSFGESLGLNIISHAKFTYLSEVLASISNLPPQLLFCSPGAWPVPLKLSDFVLYPKETSIRQNCMYLEYLVIQYEILSKDHVENSFSTKGLGAYLMGVKVTEHLLFPNDSSCVPSTSYTDTNDLKLAKKMLLFAANWTIEQSTVRDYKLYLLHFNWFCSQLKPFGQFFSTFLRSLEWEFEHPFWKSILGCHHNLSSHDLPLLSSDLVDFTSSNGTSKAPRELLLVAIDCVELLRLSYQLWDEQSAYVGNEIRSFKPILESLQQLEKEVLNKPFGSSSDVLIKLYSDLLEHHLVFWDALTSSRAEQMVISWRFLLKVASRLQDFFPNAIRNILEEARDAQRAFSQQSTDALLLWASARMSLDETLHWHSNQSLLWTHGGHPMLSASPNLHNKQQELLKLCESVWSMNSNPNKQGDELDDDPFVKIVASTNPELRFLAVQAICLSSCITSKGNKDNNDGYVVQQLEEMYQMLFQRYEHEKRKMKATLLHNKDAIWNRDSACVSLQELLCSISENRLLGALAISERTSFLLDTELLKKLSSNLLVYPDKSQLAVDGTLSLLESILGYSLHYSLTFSTRPPQNFVPHQKLLYTLDALTSMDAVNAKIASYVLEMWFMWHSSLWGLCPDLTKSLTETDNYHVPRPHMLIQPLETAFVVQILFRKSHCPVKECFVHSLILKVASQNLWQRPLLETSFANFLLSAARCLFQQIICAHEKAFDDAKFSHIKTLFYKFKDNKAQKNDLDQLSLLILSSSHQRLNECRKYIESILLKLYLCDSSTDSNLDLGYAWLLIGALRFHLLPSHDDLDPALKHNCKYLRLQEKISLVEIELKVRRECNYLAGMASSSAFDKRRLVALNKLNVKCKRLEKKTVFDRNPSKYDVLRREFENILKHVEKMFDLVIDIEAMEPQQAINQVHNWQVTATSCIDLLSEYSDYIDVAQPLQVAIYEMKLGLSLVLYGVQQRRVLDQIEEVNVQQLMESIYVFMQFPRVHTWGSISSYHTEIRLLEKLHSISMDVSGDNPVSVLQRKTDLQQNLLLRVAYFVAQARRIDNSSFQILDNIFNEFANLWMNMKVHVKSKELQGAQQIRFRPRAFEIKSVVDVDVSKLFGSDTFSELQELLSEEASVETVETIEHGSLEEEWNLNQEEMNNMINIHNELFGSIDLVALPGTLNISTANRLRSFVNSYELGAGMIRGIGGLFSAVLDAKLAPEHLLRLCLEHERLFLSSSNYKFYKDPNVTEMAKMVKSLTALQQRIFELLNEWRDHPGLKKISDMIEMLLAIPVETPLAKALSGLQFLVNRARVLEEYGSKLSLSDQLKPIISLVCSWQKMEFEYWPALLNEVERQYEVNAAELWFPLFSVLRHSSNTDGYEQSTMERLFELMRTSSVGEFSRRLQLVFAFHGQVTVARSLGLEAGSRFWEDRLDILYNLFGYHVQFLPRILEHIKANRKNIEMEVMGLLKLRRWERTEDCLSIENSKSTWQKLRKLMQKYSEFLQQPVAQLLKQEAEQRGIKIQSLPDKGPLIGICWDNAGVSSAVLDQMAFRDNSRSSIWFPDWKEKVDFALQSYCLGKIHELSFVDHEGVARTLQKCSELLPGCLLLQVQWNAIFLKLEKICKTTLGCDNLWKDKAKSVGKKRAFSELLKLLESSGLQKHKMFCHSNGFVQPSYDARHLLLLESRLPYRAPHLSNAKDEDITDVAGRLYNESLDAEWKTANEFYFKGIASLQATQQIIQKANVDVTPEQISRSESFLNHLLVIQQMQRDAAYDLAKHLKCFRELVSTVGDLFSKSTGAHGGTQSECSIAQNEHAIFECMWSQKHLFDNLNAMLVEGSVLLRTVETICFSSCQSTKPTAYHLLQFFEDSFPIMQTAKESLDKYLLGQFESFDKKLPGRIGSISTGSFHPYVISKQMEQLVYKNFQAISEFGNKILHFRKEHPGHFDGKIKKGKMLGIDFGSDIGASNDSTNTNEKWVEDPKRNSVIEILLCRFDDEIKKGKLLAEQLEQRNDLTNGGKNCNYRNESYHEFHESFERTFKLVTDVLEGQCSPNNGCAAMESSGKIPLWKDLFQSSIANLNVEELNDSLLKTILSAKKLVNHSGSGTSSLFIHFGACFEHLHSLLDLIMSLGEGLLKGLLAMQKMIAVMTYELANVLASLFSKGFGVPVESQVEDSSQDKAEDVKGTGMGEGSGDNDVSDQITDEDQLLGTSEKPPEEQDVSDEIPNKNEKGIEMVEDFRADTLSVSEDSGDENNEDDEERQLESAMGKSGVDSEVVDQKAWDKEEDDDLENRNEKYESGSSYGDMCANDRELRAKDDSAAIADDKKGDLKNEELDEQNNEVGNLDVPHDMDLDDRSMEKEEQFADPIVLNSDPNQVSDQDMDIDENMNGKQELEEKDLDENDQNAENGDPEADNGKPADGTGEEAEAEQVGRAPEKNDSVSEAEDVSDMSQMAPKKDVFGQGSDYITENFDSQPNAGTQELDSGDVAQESNMSNVNDINNNLAPLRSFPSGSNYKMDIAVSDASDIGKVTDDQQNALLSQKETKGAWKKQLNPYRNVGDALEEWKERVKVSVDLEAGDGEALEEEEDKNADEYGYVSEFQNGTAQALGPATSEQIDANVNNHKPDGDSLAGQMDEVADMEIEKQSSEEWQLKQCSSIPQNEMKQTQIPEFNKLPGEESVEAEVHDICSQGSLPESLVSVKRSYLSEEIHQLSSKLSVDDSELGKAHNAEEVSFDIKSNAASLWRRYELLTTRLSQELAEQLRLVMEPTVATKLQGDYKTGKQLIMKKVMAYIASHYRNDKMWRRRTRPNRRDYQVVIAVDDSRSMSESGCGDVAVEALVTVCRAMSQLEIGNLAVASFGKKGNIRLLHDFDQPFTGEAGAKIISNLTFRQENTIADEPVVDLLTYLNNMLDTAVAKSRLPSGQNPLEQLVLIIADGRFHEKDKLRRCVRDFLSQKRMVAFILLDGPQESIIDYQEVSFGNDGKPKFTKYLDSFPFPFYLVLRNIEALPRTLGDLLRQWFELTQYSRD